MTSPDFSKFSENLLELTTTNPRDRQQETQLEVFACSLQTKPTKEMLLSGKVLFLSQRLWVSTYCY